MTAKKLVVAKRCIVCGHPDRVLIEAARVAGCSLDAVAAKHNVARDAIWRHMKNHVSVEARADYLANVSMSEMAEKAATEGTSLLGYFSIVRGILMTQLQLAASLNNHNAAAVLAGRLTEVLREIGKVTGELSSMAVNNLTINNVQVLNSPVFANLQANLLTALQPYPEARAAVVTALRQMDEPPMKTIEHIPLAESATGVADHVPTKTISAA